MTNKGDKEDKAKNRSSVACIVGVISARRHR